MAGDTFLNSPAKDSRGIAITTVVLTIGFVSMAICLYAMSWNSLAAGFLSDDGIYVLMADAFDPFRSTDATLTNYVLRQSLFPPFYPMLMGVLGAGSGFLLWAHIITTTTLVLSLIAYGLWIFAETKDRAAVAALVVVFAALPGTLMHNLELLSEFPYLLLSLIALWLGARPTAPRQVAFMAICVGLAVLTRTAGLSLLLAMAVWLLRHRIQGRTKYLVVAVAPIALWTIYKKFAIGSVGGYDQFWLWLAGQVRENGVVSFLPRFLLGQALAFWNGLLTNLDTRPSILTHLILGTLLLSALPVWIGRLRLWKLDALYLLIGGAMIVLYPFPNFFTRLLLPWVPIVLLYAFLGARWFSVRFGMIGGKPVLSYGLAAALFLTLLPSLGFMAHRMMEPVDPVLATWKHTRYWFRFQSMEAINADIGFRQNLIIAMKDVPRWVDRGECVFGVHTAISMLYGERIFEQPPPPSASSLEFGTRMRACRYVMLMAAPGTIGGDAVPAFYPSTKLPAETADVVHVWSDPNDPSARTATLLRLKPST